MAQQADPVLTEEWTRNALLRGDCDAIAETSDLAHQRLLDHCDVFYSPPDIKFAEHPFYTFVRGNSTEERDLARRFYAPGSGGSAVCAGLSLWGVCVCFCYTFAITFAMPLAFYWLGLT